MTAPVASLHNNTNELEKIGQKFVVNGTTREEVVIQPFYLDGVQRLRWTISELDVFLNFNRGYGRMCLGANCLAGESIGQFDLCRWGLPVHVLPSGWPCMILHAGLLEGESDTSSCRGHCHNSVSLFHLDARTTWAFADAMKLV